MNNDVEEVYLLILFINIRAAEIAVNAEQSSVANQRTTCCRTTR